MNITKHVRRPAFCRCYGMAESEYDALIPQQQKVVKKDFLKFLQDPTDMVDAPRFVDMDGNEMTLFERAEMFETIDRHLGHDKVHDRFKVSTIFLGLNHGTSTEPLYFETMIFMDGVDFTDIYCDRYATKDQAIEGHKAVVQQLKEKTLSIDSKYYEGI